MKNAGKDSISSERDFNAGSESRARWIIATEAQQPWKYIRIGFSSLTASENDSSEQMSKLKESVSLSSDKPMSQPVNNQASGHSATPIFLGSVLPRWRTCQFVLCVDRWSHNLQANSNLFITISGFFLPLIFFCMLQNNKRTSIISAFTDQFMRHLSLSASTPARTFCRT